MDLSHADLRGADLRDADFQSALLMHADLRGADLRGADLRGANLSAANLSHAQLQGSKLNYACLNYSDFSYCDLSHADLRKAEIWQAYFYQTNMTDVICTQYPFMQEQPPVKSKRILVEGYGYRIYVWNTHLMDQNPPISICLHGMTGHALDFHDLAQQIPHLIYAIDLPGHGESSALPLRLSDLTLDFNSVTPSLPTWDQVIEHLMVVITRLVGDQPFHLLGYSMGGRIALALACAMHQQESKLAHLLQHLHLVSASCGLDHEQARSERRQDDQKWIDLLLTGELDEFLTLWSQQKVLSIKPLDPIMENSFYSRQHMHDPFQLAYAFHILGLASMPPYHALLPQVLTPTTCYTGQLDQKFHLKAQQICQGLPHGHHHVVPQAGHRLLYEDLTSFTQDYLSFCTNKS